MAADPLKLDFAVTPTTQHPAAEQDTFEWNWNMEPLLNIYNLIPDPRLVEWKLPVVSREQ